MKRDRTPHIGAPAGTPRRAPGPPCVAKSRILVVDDNDANRALLDSVLRRAGYSQIELLRDSADVLSVVLRFRPDLIMLDLHMPVLSGFDVMALLREHVDANDFLPILVVTADATAATREQVLSAGAKDLLIKPIDRIEALQRTANLLETRHLTQQLRAHNRQLERSLYAHAEQSRLEAEQRLAKRQAVERVLEEQQMHTVFQPIIDGDSGVIIGVEALTRFDAKPNRSPTSWFADAAEVGLGPQLEIAAIHAAVKLFPALPHGAYVALNCSPQILASAELRAIIDSVDPTRIVLEITEHEVIDDYASIRATLNALRSCGVRIAVDDAGSGFSSLSHILQLEPNIIKLDIALTRGIDADPAKRALAAALVGFAGDVGANLVAEGIETVEEFQTVRDLGIKALQGFLLGRPQVPPVVNNLVPLRSTAAIAGTLAFQ